ncbi:MAG: mechanosensory protein 2 [Dehalococcoidia bacterium]|nr:mechanosensory protein 2 [Dehalococcoidia bacterium]
MNLFLWIVIGVVVVVLFFLSVRIVRQWERGVLLRFGRLMGVRNPGFNFIVPIVDRLVKVDLRIVTMVLEPQEIITKDNVTIKVTAVVYFQVVDPIKSVVNIEAYDQATTQIALTSLRSVLGQSELDELLAHREQVNAKLRTIIEEQTEKPWGVRVTIAEVKDVLLPDSMQRAMARQAEAERERRAKVIHAQGEFAAAQTLADAAKIIQSEPAALQLRYLQTLTEIAGEKSNTIIPLPLDILGMKDALLGKIEKAARNND